MYSSYIIAKKSLKQYVKIMESINKINYYIMLFKQILLMILFFNNFQYAYLLLILLSKNYLNSIISEMPIIIIFWAFL